MLIVIALAIISVRSLGSGETSETASESGSGGEPATTATTTTTLPPFEGWVDPASFGKPYGTEVDGLIAFRGNPTRSYYGESEIGDNPAQIWAYPQTGGMCSQSSTAAETKTWCGTGWTGQPAAFKRDGKTWVVFGAYDRKVHFVDGTTGADILAPFSTGDIIKGSVTIDPDGYPLVYTGSRDNYLRVLAFDGDSVRELWKLNANAVSPTLWNNDWDGNPLVLDDYLFEGGENSQIHIIKLNRGYDESGAVTVNPSLVFNAPGWDSELLGALGDKQVSIENSVTIVGNMMYFSNSGGLVQGWNIEGFKDGKTPERTFRFWSGDDTDATIVADETGAIYGASEWERHNSRSTEVGQVFKLDPSQPDPLVWKFDTRKGGKAGVWATPAVTDTHLYVPTHTGEFMALDRETGAQIWEKKLPGPLWSSPVVVGDTLIQTDCNGFVHAFDISDPNVDPPERWSLELGSCIESTPAVYDGSLYVGTRGGKVFGVKLD